MFLGILSTLEHVPRMGSALSTNIYHINPVEYQPVYKVVFVSVVVHISLVLHIRISISVEASISMLDVRCTMCSAQSLKMHQDICYQHNVNLSINCILCSVSVRLDITLCVIGLFDQSRMVSTV